MSDSGFVVKYLPTSIDAVTELDVAPRAGAPTSIAGDLTARAELETDLPTRELHEMLAGAVSH
jgi:hypothetical protein